MTPMEVHARGHNVHDSGACPFCEPGYPIRCPCGGWIHATFLREQLLHALGRTHRIFDVSCDTCGDEGPEALQAKAKAAGNEPQPMRGLWPGAIVFFRHNDGLDRPAIVLDVYDPVAGIVALRVFTGNDQTRTLLVGPRPPGEDFEIRAIYAEPPQKGQWHWPPRTA